MTIEDAAKDLDLAKSTVRYNLKSIFSKTGTNRQAQLVKLILSTPILIEPNNNNVV